MTPLIKETMTFHQAVMIQTRIHLVDKIKRCHHLEVKRENTDGQGDGKYLNKKTNGGVTNGEQYSGQDGGNDEEEKDTKHGEKSKQDTNIISEQLIEMKGKPRSPMRVFQVTHQFWGKRLRRKFRTRPKGCHD
jgi:hypothetical protein